MTSRTGVTGQLLQLQLRLPLFLVRAGYAVDDRLQRCAFLRVLSNQLLTLQLAVNHAFLCHNQRLLFTEREVERTQQRRTFLIADRKSTRLNSSHVKISYA